MIGISSRIRRRALLLSLTAFAASTSIAPSGPADATEPPTIVVASTTSTENSGLFGWILPKFLAASGIRVHVVAVGTGQAIRIAERGDADVLLVHDRLSEEAFVRDGFGLERHPIMYNEFVLLGPKDDPAGIGGTQDAAAAFAKIASQRAPFLSRGDDSGTHKAEMRLWSAAGVDPRPHSGTWYLETGSGMGQTLNTAVEKNAYVLSDDASWRSFENKRDLGILVQGDTRLHNPYSVILVDPRRHPHVKAEAGATFVRWLLSAEGQRAIGSFERDGSPLFTPSVTPSAGTANTGAGAP